MGQKQFWFLIGALQVFLIFSKIYRHNKIIRLTYTKQKLEQTKQSYKKEHEKLLVQLHMLKEPSLVARQAQVKMNLRQLNLSQIRQLSYEDCQL